MPAFFPIETKMRALSWRIEAPPSAGALARLFQATVFTRQLWIAISPQALGGADFVRMPFPPRAAIGLTFCLFLATQAAFVFLRRSGYRSR